MKWNVKSELTVFHDEDASGVGLVGGHDREVFEANSQSALHPDWLVRPWNEQVLLINLYHQPSLNTF